MQKQPVSGEYRLRFEPFRFLDDASVRPFHLAEDSPASGMIDELHYHDGLELGLCLEGAGVFIIDGEPLTFSAPCATILYPQQFHKARSTLLPSRWYFATFCPELLLPDLGDSVSRELFSPKTIAPEQSLLSPGTPLYQLVFQIVEEMRSRPPLFLECIRGLLQALVVTHSRTLEPSQEISRRDRNRIGPVVSYISQHFREDLTISGIAGQFGVGETTLRRWFWEAMRTTPLDYLHKVRLSAACSLLRAGELPVLDIAMTVGYNSLSSFHRQFRKIHNCSPSEYIHSSAPPQQN